MFLPVYEFIAIYNDDLFYFGSTKSYNWKTPSDISKRREKKEERYKSIEGVVGKKENE